MACLPMQPALFAPVCWAAHAGLGCKLCCPVPGDGKPHAVTHARGAFAARFVQLLAQGLPPAAPCPLSTHPPAHPALLPLLPTQVVAVTGRLLKADDRQLEALVLRGRAYFYLVRGRRGTQPPSVLLLLAESLICI